MLFLGLGITLNQLSRIMSLSPFNVKKFGATGNARKLADVAITDGTGAISSASANFTTADIGRKVWAVNSVGTLVLPVGTITSVANSTTATASTSGLGSWSGVSMVIGTDDTAALQAASAAADAATPRGNIVVPAGGYIFNQTPFVWTNSAYQFRRPSIFGEGSSHTHFYAQPGATLSNGCIFNYDDINGTTHFAGFTLDGANATFSGNQGIFISSSANFNLLEDIRVQNFTGVLSGVSAAGGTIMRVCHIESIWGGRGVYNTGNLTFDNSYAGNCGYRSIDCANANLLCLGSILDESNAGTIYLNNSTARLLGTLVYAGGSYTAVEVNGTSVLHANNSQLRQFSSNLNTTGLAVLSGGKAYLQGCYLLGSGTGYGLNNAGTVYDGGNNESNSKTGAGTITTLAL